MSGHSKFANIKHKKERNDAAKGKIFTVIGREIAVAVKEVSMYRKFSEKMCLMTRRCRNAFRKVFTKN